MSAVLLFKKIYGVEFANYLPAWELVVTDLEGLNTSSGSNEAVIVVLLTILKHIL